MTDAGVTAKVTVKHVNDIHMPEQWYSLIEKCKRGRTYQVVHMQPDFSQSVYIRVHKNDDVASHGADKIALCTFKYFDGLETTTETLIAYSDNCGRQNENRTNNWTLDAPYFREEEIIQRFPMDTPRCLVTMTLLTLKEWFAKFRKVQKLVSGSIMDLVFVPATEVHADDHCDVSTADPFSAN